MTVSVDPSSVPLLGSVGPDRFLEWTGGADLLFPNLTEGETLTGEEDPDRILEKLLPYYSAVVLKLGPTAPSTQTRAEPACGSRPCRWTSRTLPGLGTPSPRGSWPRGWTAGLRRRRCEGVPGSPAGPSERRGLPDGVTSRDPYVRAHSPSG
jgi:hypothetical protein